MQQALITWGGWEGHQPDKVAALFAEVLRVARFQPFSPKEEDFGRIYLRSEAETAFRRKP